MKIQKIIRIPITAVLIQLIFGASSALAQSGAMGCSEIFSESNFEKGIDSLARSFVRLSLENDLNPNSLNRDNVHEKLAKELSKYVTTQEQKEQFKKLVVFYKKKLRGEVDSKNQMIRRAQEKKKERIKEEARRMAELDPQNLIKQATFYKVTPGKYEKATTSYKEKNGVVSIKVTHTTTREIPENLEIMATPMTQKFFTQLMRLIYDNFKDEELSPLLKTEVGENPSHFRGEDHPVERIKWDHIMGSKGIVEKLNELSENGDIDIQNQIAQIFKGHQKGLKYRLPEIYEQQSVHEQMRTEEGLSVNELLILNDENKLLEHFVYHNTPGNGTNGILSQKVFYYQGKPMVMGGNVTEWMLTAYNSQGVVCCGSWRHDAKDLRSGTQREYWPNSTDNYVGFRLARTSL